MVEIIFDYDQIETTIQANLDDSFNSVIEKFINKTKLDINNIYYISNGNIISSKNEKIMGIMNKTEKINKKKMILVLPINNSINNDNTNINKTKIIRCPTCKDICKYEIENYKINLYGCKNEHIMNNIKLNEFYNTQNIDMSKIKCDKCNNKSMLETFNNEFYICFECNMNLCPLCKSVHDKTHSIINYEYKYYICNKHNEKYIKYCEDCKIDLCLFCIKEHKNHKLISYEDILIDIRELRKKMDNLNMTINEFKKNIEEIITKLKKLENNLDIYYNINNNIIINYEINKIRNYNLLVNLNNINNDIDREINKLKNDYNCGNNFNKLLDLYNEINGDNKRTNEINNEINENINEINEDYIIINYKLNMKNEKLRIFGKYFVRNNKNKCKIIYENKEYNLCEYLNDINNEYNNNDNIITIKLKDYNNIIDMSYMFCECTQLYSLPNISKWNTSNVKNMYAMFYECTELSSLPDISKWDTLNVNYMSLMFCNCTELLSLPDISKWNTTNVNNMSGIFAKCSKLSSLPDISKWDTSKVIDMSLMFCDIVLNYVHYLIYQNGILQMLMI